MDLLIVGLVARLKARGVAQLGPASCVHPGQLQQLAVCVDRGVRREWLQQQKQWP